MQITDVPAIAAAVIAIIQVVIAAIGAFIAYRANGAISLGKTLTAARSAWPVIVEAYKAVTTDPGADDEDARDEAVEAGLREIVRQRGRALPAVEVRKADAEIRARLEAAFPAKVEPVIR